jgi:hypothetical protein
MINICMKIICIFENTINYIINSHNKFILFILLIILYGLINYIFSHIEKDLITNTESIIITIPHTYVYKNIIIIILIFLSNFLYNLIFK